VPCAQPRRRRAGAAGAPPDACGGVQDRAKQSVAKNVRVHQRVARSAQGRLLPRPPRASVRRPGRGVGAAGRAGGQSVMRVASRSECRVGAPRLQQGAAPPQHLSCCARPATSHAASLGGGEAPTRRHGPPGREGARPGTIDWFLQSGPPILKAWGPRRGGCRRRRRRAAASRATRPRPAALRASSCSGRPRPPLRAASGGGQRGVGGRR
jgi:hypothetical protein